MVLPAEYHFGKAFIYEKLAPLKQTDDARNFEPLYAPISQFLADLASKLSKNGYF